MIVRLVPGGEEECRPSVQAEREGRREGGGKEGREGGGRERRKGGREGGREGEKEGGREKGKEGGREGGNTCKEESIGMSTWV